MKRQPKIWWAFAHLGEECLPKEAKLTSRRREGAFLGVGSPQGVEGTSQHGKGGISWEGCLPREAEGTSWQGGSWLPGKGSFSYGETAAGDDDAVEHWMQHRKEKRMGVPWAV